MNLHRGGVWQQNVNIAVLQVMVFAQKVRIKNINMDLALTNVCFVEAQTQGLVLKVLMGSIKNDNKIKMDKAVASRPALFCFILSGRNCFRNNLCGRTAYKFYCGVS
jgi:hypothetical protein